MFQFLPPENTRKMFLEGKNENIGQKWVKKNNIFIFIDFEHVSTILFWVMFGHKSLFETETSKNEAYSRYEIDK